MSLAILSSTHDPMYQFFIPIVAYSWQKLGYYPFIFTPPKNDINESKRLVLALKYMRGSATLGTIECNKESAATYMQSARLCGGAIKRVQDDEQIVVGDIDMAVFAPPPVADNQFCIFGADLVPQGQLPMCYISAPKRLWRQHFTQGRSVQQTLQAWLGDVQCENMRGNYWAFDQEKAYNTIMSTNPRLINRARQGTQFAENRIDRDDAYWEERLSIDIIDAHLWRPGYTEENAQKIAKLFEYMYQDNRHDWIIEYAEKYRKLVYSS